MMTSCHVSLNPKRGPVMPHTRMMVTARTNVTGRPEAREVHFAKRVKKEVDFVALIFLVYEIWPPFFDKTHIILFLARYLALR